MGSKMLTEVKINGNDIASAGTGRLVKYKIIKTFGQSVKEVVIHCSKTIWSDDATLSQGQTISVKRGFTTSTDKFEFDGYIDRIDKQGPITIIYGKDKLVDLIKATVAYTYDGVSTPLSESKGSDIATSLIETWGGLTATVVDTGSVMVLNKFICDYTDVLSRLQKLAEIYDYQIYYSEADSTVHFEPNGYTTNSDTIYIGGTYSNCSKIPVWKSDNSQCMNHILIKGAVQEVQDIEFFNGDNTTSQVFTLAAKPIMVHTYEEVATVWVLKTPGVVDSTSGSYDYEIDSEGKLINCTTNWTPASGTNNVRVIYTKAIPAPVDILDDESIDKYGTYRAVLHYHDIQGVDDAERRANGLLKKFKNPFIETSLMPINLINYFPGEKVNVIDIKNTPNEDRTLVINKITMEYPYKGDKVDVGDKEWKLADWGQYTIERIRRLEEELQKETDLVVQIRYFAQGVTHQRRYARALQQTILGEGFILGSVVRGRIGTDKLGDPYQTGLVWGNTDYGDWGTYYWSDGTDQTEVQIRCVWYNGQVVEDFKTVVFKGTADTTAVWTNTGTLGMTNAETAQSTYIYDNDVNLSKATLTATGGTAVAWYLRSDLTNWESVTSGVEHTFVYTGAKLQWKGIASGTADITEVKIDVTEV